MNWTSLHKWGSPKWFYSISGSLLPWLAAAGTVLLAIAGVINIPIIKYSVEWWNTLHQPASFSLAHKPAMPAQMWLPLLLAILAFYCFFGAVLFTRMRLEVLRREAGSRWADAEIARLLEDRT